MSIFKAIKNGISEIVNQFYLFTLEAKFKRMETQEAKAMRLLTEEIESWNNKAR